MKNEPAQEYMLSPADRIRAVRGAVLIAAGGLALFFAFILVIHALDWVRPNITALARIFPGLILLNLLLSATARFWAGWKSVAFLYEGLHAVVLTVILHFFGGTHMGSFIIVYGFLVVHTEMMRSDASVFVTANFCSLCFAGLTLVERMGWVVHERVFDVRYTLGQEIGIVLFSVMSLNFLALYANRYGHQGQTHNRNPHAGVSHLPGIAHSS